MVWIYIAIVILFLIIFLKATLHFRYEIVSLDVVKSYICISILNFKVYENKSENSIYEIIEKSIKSKEKKKKVGKEVNDTKMTFQEIAKHVAKEKINLTVSVGLANSIVTVYLVPILATVISMYLANNVKQKYIKNIEYNIYPQYLRTYILVDAKIKTRVLVLIKVFFLKNKYKGEKNGKSSD